MSLKCPRVDCSGHVRFQTPDGPAICERGHPLSVRDVSARVREFYNRVSRGASA